MKRQKTKVMAINNSRARRGISLFSEKEENYESEMKDNTNPN